MILNFKNLDVCNLLIPSNGQSIWPFMFCIYCVKRLSWNSTTLANLVDNQSEEFFLQEGRVLGSFVDFFLEVFTKFKISCFFLWIWGHSSPKFCKTFDSSKRPKWYLNKMGQLHEKKFHLVSNHWYFCKRKFIHDCPRKFCNSFTP